MAVEEEEKEGDEEGWLLDWELLAGVRRRGESSCADVLLLFGRTSAAVCEEAAVAE